MDFNEQTELTSKIERDSESRLTALVGGLGVEGNLQNQKLERTHGQGQQCGDCGWQGRRVEVEEGMGG